MGEKNPKYINVVKFIDYCEKNNIAISRMDYSKDKVINLSSRELIEEYNYFLGRSDCRDNLRYMIQSSIKSHRPYDTNTGDMYSDAKFVSPQHLTEELIKLLDNENVAAILQLYYQSRNNGEK